jgi:lipoate-protein ligase A
VAVATEPALVLGSTQPLETARPGLDVAVVRRRTGGGAVWVAPGDPVWVDVVVPAGDPLWDDDVARAFWWLGEAWAAAVRDLGLGSVEVHRGPMLRSPLSRLVCFAGVGAGEVLAGGRKVVGIAQRRTRQGALFQCAVPKVWDPAPLVDALRLDAAERAAVDAALGDVATGIGLVDDDDVVLALVAHLP